MISNAFIYRIAAGFSIADAAALEDRLATARFAPCGPSQERASGWIEPRGEPHGPLVESIGGHLITKHMVEVKTVPGSLMKRKVEEARAEIEKEVGRKPGRKETRELKEQVLLGLLPMAFAKQSATLVWIDRATGLLVLGTSSQARADAVVTALVEALPGFSVAQIDTQTGPAASMAHWLVEQEPPAGFSVDRECELRATDGSKAVVRYGSHPLDIDEVKEHIQHGKMPTRLALTWDERASFVLTDGLQLRKIVFLDAVFDGTAGKKPDGFEADVAIATGELSRLIPELLDALGGEAVPK